MENLGKIAKFGESMEKIPLNEFITLQRGYDLPQHSRIAGKYPVVASTGIVGFHNEYKAKANGVVIGRSGSIGGGQFITEDFFPLNTTLYVKDFKGHNPRYIYYLLRSIDFSGFNVGTGVPTLNRNHLSSILIKNLGREKEDRIAIILGDIDDKIQLNTKTNQTLEAIAQAIFKSWFVDFDPVRAKAQAISEGKSEREANLSAMAVISGKSTEELNETEFKQLWEIADAFPSEFVESKEFGEVPKGWEVKHLPEIIDFLEGPGIRNWQYTENEDGIRFINIRCIKNKDLSLDTANRITKDEAFGKYAHFQLKEDDIVISTSGTLGKFAFVRKNHLPLCLNTSVIRFRAIENVSTLAFITGFVETQLQNELETRASGSVQKNFGPTHLKQIRMLVPDFNILSLHQSFLQFCFEKRKVNLNENDSLVTIRNLLLPRLLSGELQNE